MKMMALRVDVGGVPMHSLNERVSSEVALADFIFERRHTHIQKLSCERHLIFKSLQWLQQHEGTRLAEAPPPPLGYRGVNAGRHILVRMWVHLHNAYDTCPLLGNSSGTFTWNRSLVALEKWDTPKPKTTNAEGSQNQTLD